MQNAPTPRLTARQARERAHVISPVRIGYLDAAARRPYPPEYERAEPWWQQNYNAGRLIALDLRADHGCVAAWPSTTILPKHIEAGAYAVARGLARMPDQP